MDPQACLQDIRDAIGGSDFIKAAELFDALDEWLCRAGYLPHDWVVGVEKGRHAK